MPMRFLLDDVAAVPRPGAEIQLGAERSHYLCKVMRLRRGDTLECFDGQGGLYAAQVLQASTRATVLRIESVARAEVSGVSDIHLGISLLKGAAMDRALQQATELGANAVSLLDARYSNVKVTGARLANKLSHWQKVIAGACEQSGRLILPPLHAPRPVADFIAEQTAAGVEVTVLDQHAPHLPKSLPQRARALLIGPEGGWAEIERDLFEKLELPRYSLGDTVLRAETVPAVALALLQHVTH